MKNFTQKILISVGIATGTAYAGGSDQILPTSDTFSKIVPYVDIMAGLNSRNAGVGRGAIGLMFPYNPKISFTSEVGWGWYGSQTINQVVFNNNAVLGQETENTSNQGFDLLFGAKYNFNPKIAAFLKVGGLVLNQKNDFNTFGQISFSKIMPETMVGLEYNFNPSVGVFAAYTHVFDTASTSMPSGTTMAGLEFHFPSL